MGQGGKESAGKETVQDSSVTKHFVSHFFIAIALPTFTLPSNQTSFMPGMTALTCCPRIWKLRKAEWVRTAGRVDCEERGLSPRVAGRRYVCGRHRKLVYAYLILDLKSSFPHLFM